MSLQVPVFFRCTACPWRWGPIRGVAPHRPGSREQQCWVYCASCKQPASAWGEPDRLPFSCNCGGKDYRLLDRCPECGSPTTSGP